MPCNLLYISFQAACAVTILNRFANGLPYIITGDFNSTPDFAPYNLMATGEFDYSVDHWNTKPLFDLFPWSDEEVCNMTVKVPSQPLLKVDNHPRFVSITCDVLAHAHLSPLVNIDHTFHSYISWL